MCSQPCHPHFASTHLSTEFTDYETHALSVAVWRADHCRGRPLRCRRLLDLGRDAGLVLYQYCSY
jgi:hypothetical protein